MGDWPGKPCSEFGSQWTGDSRERVKREERNAGEGGVGSPTIETSFRVLVVLVVLVVLDDNDVDSTLM